MPVLPSQLILSASQPLSTTVDSLSPQIQQSHPHRLVPRLSDNSAYALWIGLPIGLSLASVFGALALAYLIWQLWKRFQRRSTAPAKLPQMQQPSIQAPHPPISAL